MSSSTIRSSVLSPSTAPLADFLDLLDDHVEHTLVGAQQPLELRDLRPHPLELVEHALTLHPG